MRRRKKMVWQGLRKSGAKTGFESHTTIAFRATSNAAADMPPISNLWKYTGMGFDLVAFSAGKGMRGPQSAVLLLGKKHLTDLANQNNNRGDGVGRGMKVAKEQIVGLVAAVDWVLSHTEESISHNRGAHANRRSVEPRAHS
jgi:seryl-tRNA(Sec) selenium transferase